MISFLAVIIYSDFLILTTWIYKAARKRISSTDMAFARNNNGSGSEYNRSRPHFSASYDIMEKIDYDAMILIFRVF